MNFLSVGTPVYFVSRPWIVGVIEEVSERDYSVWAGLEGESRRMMFTAGFDEVAEVISPLPEKLTILGKVELEELEVLRNWCRARIKDMHTNTRSKYVSARKQLWLFAECDLRKQASLKPAYFDQYIWDLAQRVYPGCQLGLLTYNGLISWHGDHHFAQREARVINLGDAAFGYQSGERKIFHLSDGLIARFNCKNPHAVLKHSAERFSIVLWKLNPLYAEQYARLSNFIPF